MSNYIDESLASLASKVGVEKTVSPSEINKYISKNAVHFLPQYRFDNQIFLSELLDQRLLDKILPHNWDLTEQIQR